MSDVTCAGCGRTVTTVNYNEGTGLCVFCDGGAAAIGGN